MINSLVYAAGFISVTGRVNNFNHTQGYVEIINDEDIYRAFIKKSTIDQIRNKKSVTLNLPVEKVRLKIGHRYIKLN